MILGSALEWLLTGTIPVGPGILVREVVGNGFGLASALLGMRRRVLAWPLGIFGNVLLFTVFLGGVFSTPEDMNLFGQAGRQVLFAALGIYGWVTWRRSSGDGGGVAHFIPRWGTRREIIIAAVALLGIYGSTYVILAALNSYAAWADAWILTGSLAAVYATARGYLEAWLFWIAIDLVGVPLLVAAGLYPSALLYTVYLVVAAFGLRSWLAIRTQAHTSPAHDGASASRMEDT
jgi:nicotinamide mononucleotide transporter